MDEPRILLIGMMGSGKTTVGRELAERTGWPYVDNDTLVQEATGRTAREIRATDGEDILHLAEGEALDRALGLPAPVVVGVAASVVTDPAAREALRDGGYVVWLRARPETLTERIGAGATRRADATDPDWLRRTARERAPLFAAVAHQVVEVDEARPGDVAEAILAGLTPAEPSAG